MQKLLRTDLSPLARGWHTFIHANISSSSHKSNITAPQARILHAIMDGLSINLGSIIARDIKAAANAGSEASLQHPFLITEFCAQEGIDVEVGLPVPTKASIDEVYICQYCYTDEDEDAQAEEQGHGQPPVPPRPRHSTYEFIKQVDRRMDHFERNLTAV